MYFKSELGITGGDIQDWKLIAVFRDDYLLKTDISREPRLSAIVISGKHCYSRSEVNSFIFVGKQREFLNYFRLSIVFVLLALEKKILISSISFSDGNNDIVPPLFHRFEVLDNVFLYAFQSSNTFIPIPKSRSII